MGVSSDVDAELGGDDTFHTRLERGVEERRLRAVVGEEGQQDGMVAESGDQGDRVGVGGHFCDGQAGMGGNTGGKGGVAGKDGYGMSILSEDGGDDGRAEVACCACYGYVFGHVGVWV